MRRYLQSLTKYLPSLASIAIGVLPILVITLSVGVSRKVIGKGALAYAAGAVGLKLPLYHLLVVKVLHKKLSNSAIAISQGLVSSVSELGAALGFFLFVTPELTLGELIGFGMAAGSIEAIILPFMKNPLQGTPLESHAEEILHRSSQNLSVEWLGVVERILATLIHISSRGLVYVSYSTGNPVPGFLAFTGFAAIDGRAYYAHLQKWQFDDIRVLLKFYKYLGTMAIVLTVLFTVSYYLWM